MRPQYKNPEHQHFNDKLPLVYGSNTDSSLNGLNDLNDVYDLNNENKRKKFISKVYLLVFVIKLKKYLILCYLILVFNYLHYV